MFVRTLELVWCAVGREPEVRDDPTWSDIVQAFYRLDGNTVDGVVLSGPEHAYMGIVGNPGVGFVVAGKLTNGNGFILDSGKAFEAFTPVNVGGQDNEYANYELNALADVVIAAKRFYETGSCDINLFWNDKAAKRGGKRSIQIK